MSDENTILLQGKLIIGLTGNIATGKSAVMRLAADQDALTIDADKVVHEIMDTNENMQATLAVAFGPEVRQENGRIDRKKLGSIVFNDPQALQDLEEILHPVVRRKIATRIQESDATIVMLEAIKLLESSLVEVCHKVWVTRCSQTRQLERLRICRGLDTAEATARIKAQSSQEGKVAQADMVIDTNGLMRDTELQFKMAWRRLPDPAKVDSRHIEAPVPIAPKLAAKEVKEVDTNGSSSGKTAPPLLTMERPDNLKVRRAKPTDIPAILLLIQKATDGKLKMKRAELLMALSERGYFIGQVESDISTVVGFSIDSQVASVDEMYVYPLEMAAMTGTAVIAEIEQSAYNHLSEIIIIYLPNDTPDEIRHIFDAAGYKSEPKEQLARNWQQSVEETQPDDTFFLIKLLRDTRKT